MTGAGHRAWGATRWGGGTSTGRGRVGTPDRPGTTGHSSVRRPHRPRPYATRRRSSLTRSGGSRWGSVSRCRTAAASQSRSTGPAAARKDLVNSACTVRTAAALRPVGGSGEPHDHPGHRHVGDRRPARGAFPVDDPRAVGREDHVLRMQVPVQQHLRPVPVAERRGEPLQRRHRVHHGVQPRQQPGLPPERQRPAAKHGEHGRPVRPLHHDVAPGDVEHLGHRHPVRPGVRHDLGLPDHPVRRPPVPVPPQHPPVPGLVNIRAPPARDQPPRPRLRHAPSLPPPTTPSH